MTKGTSSNARLVALRLETTVISMKRRLDGQRPEGELQYDAGPEPEHAHAGGAELEHGHLIDGLPELAAV